MHQKNVLQAGIKLGDASKVLVMIHGRGATAESIVSMAGYFDLPDFCILAPQASGNSWYPYSFLAKAPANEPWLSSAIDTIGEVVKDIVDAGIAEKDIYFLGFSQGACLTAEFVTRNSRRYGGVAILTGGLIGDVIDISKYSGDFEGTPVFLGSGDPDMHVPVERVNDTADLLTKMNASVKLKIYNGMGHTINDDEINNVNYFVFAG